MKTLFIGSDHAGFNTKTLLCSVFANEFDVHDCGSFSSDRVDYTHFSHILAKKVQENHGSFGILVCGSGVGVSIVANRYKGVRAALIYNNTIAGLARQHNNANVACFGARFFTESQIIEMARVFLSKEFSGGVHSERVENIDQSA